MRTLDVAIGKKFPPGPDSAGFDLDVRFTAGDGISVLFGPSGAGKTLTLESIAGFQWPDEGRITLDGKVLFDAAQGVHLPARARQCGYVFQKDALFPHMSVRGNLAFAAEALPKEERTRRIHSLLDHFALTPLAGRRPHEISGGERQRCAIARTLVTQPRLLLLDEPARGLDVELRRQLYQILRQVRSEFGVGMLLVTHSLEEAFELADRMFVYRQGRIEQEGDPRQVCAQPVSTAVARLFGVFSILQGRITAHDRDRDATRIETPEVALETTYLEGCPSGVTVDFCVHPEKVIATPRNGACREREIRLPLLRAVEMPNHVRLEFPGPLAAWVTREAFARAGDAHEWSITFPKGSVWIFR